MVKVECHGKYQSDLNSLLSQEHDLFQEMDKRVKWFQKNPDDTRLDNHPLTKRLEGKWAFSITDDIRIVYEWVGKTTVRFLAIGRHTRIYSTKN